MVESVRSGANNVLLLTLRPKNGRLVYWPGQYAAIGFKQGLRRSPMRCFSLVSSPYEPNLQFAMRRQGSFTDTIAHLTPGSEVFVQGPFGNFVIDSEEDKQLVFLAAGIGITPFISTLRYMAQKQLNIPVTLVYSCRSALDIPFRNELLNLTKVYPFLTIKFLVSEPVPTELTDSRVVQAKLDTQQLANLDDRPGTTYMICGPNGYMKHATDLLLTRGVDPSRIVTESFTQGKKTGWRLGQPQTVVYGLAALVMFVGMAGIAVLDLARAVPKLASAQSKTNTSTSALPAATTTTTATQNQATTPVSSTSSQSTSNNQNNAFYSPPMTSVS